MYMKYKKDFDNKYLNNTVILVCSVIQVLDSLFIERRFKPF